MRHEAAAIVGHAAGVLADADAVTESVDHPAADDGAVLSVLGVARRRDRSQSLIDLAATAFLRARRVQLLFTDVVMPEINGRKLADEAPRMPPGMPALFTTGYTRNAISTMGFWTRTSH